MKSLSKMYSAFIGFINVICGIFVAILRKIPFVSRENVYSIGIFEGDSPFRVTPNGKITNPVLTAREVNDLRARGVADPFIVNDGSNWYMFFEVVCRDTRKGKIGLATSNDGFNWDYQKIIIDEPFHLSYPYIFKHDNEYLMIPETREAGHIRLYQALEFPSKWIFVTNLIRGDYVDASIFQYGDKWWAFAGSGNCDMLHLFSANSIMGPWVEHPKSPIVKNDKSIARPGGRAGIYNGKIIRFAQNCEPFYGYQLRAVEITELTTQNYHEQEFLDNPVLKGSGTGWNKLGMHHIDLHQIKETNRWIAAVDGCREKWFFDFGFFEL